MIELYMFATPNCWRASIALEEVGLPYKVRWVDLMNKGNASPEFLKKNPTAKVPLLNDDGAIVYGSAAIQLHLADKTGKLMPKSGMARGEALDWFMFVVTDLCNAFNNHTRFKVFLKPTDEFAVKTFEGDIERFCKVADERLAGRTYLCGDYSMVDVALAPFLAGPRNQDALLAKFPNLKRWAEAVKSRPGVQKGCITQQPKEAAA